MSPESSVQSPPFLSQEHKRQRLPFHLSQRPQTQLISSDTSSCLKSYLSGPMKSPKCVLTPERPTALFFGGTFGNRRRTGNGDPPPLPRGVCGQNKERGLAGQRLSRGARLPPDGFEARVHLVCVSRTSCESVRT